MPLFVRIIIIFAILGIGGPIAYFYGKKKDRDE